MYEFVFDYVRAVKEGGRPLENVVQSLLKMDLADRMMKRPGNDVNHPALSLYGKRVQSFMKYLQDWREEWH